MVRLYFVVGISKFILSLLLLQS